MFGHDAPVSALISNRAYCVFFRDGDRLCLLSDVDNKPLPVIKENQTGGIALRNDFLIVLAKLLLIGAEPRTD
jgi:hypothetical protein